MKKIEQIDLGIISYNDALRRQQCCFEEIVAAKIRKETPDSDYWISCEHLPVITCGKHAKKEHLLLSEADLALRGIELVATDRGGDVTFHGPGQLVVYPILDLEKYGLGLRAYIDLLEECVIRTLTDYDIVGERVTGAAGVWVEKGTVRERKICAIGVKSSRYVTMHGLALNINTDLSCFSLIHPCGFTDKGVTSLMQETGIKHNLREVSERLTKHASQLLECDFFS
ncbi:MAG: lipoyl(octanoyl) transferase LipB [Bacteroidales bacterium]